MKTLVTSLLFTLSLSLGYGQANISTLALNTGGAFFEMDDYMISSNIGEMSLVNTFFTPDFILTNGVLQPLVKRIPDNQNLIQSLRIYPTLTTTNYVFLESKLGDYTIGKVTIYNSIGQKFYQKTLVLEQINQNSKIELNSSGTGTYFIEVTLFTKDGSKYYNKVFKIQKI